MKKLINALALAALTALWGGLPAAAKGPPEWVRISGAAMYRPIDVTDPELLQELGPARLEIVDEPAILSPAGITHILHLERGFEGESGDLIAFDEVLYAFDPQGGPGYVYYLGIANGSGPYDGKWYPASEQGAASLRTALEQSGVSMVNFPAGGEFAGQQLLSAGQMALLLTVAMAAALAGWAFGRRSGAAAVAQT